LPPYVQCNARYSDTLQQQLDASRKPIDFFVGFVHMFSGDVGLHENKFASIFQLCDLTSNERPPLQLESKRAVTLWLEVTQLSCASCTITEDTATIPL